MAKQPWFKFNPAKWQGDHALRTCKPATRLLWLEMLCIMHDAVPRGHLLINGLIPPDDELAGIVNLPKKVVSESLLELKMKRVFDVTSGGVIYSRRMVRESEVSEIQRKNAGARWDGEGDRHENGNADLMPPPMPKKREEREEKESTTPTTGVLDSAPADAGGGGDEGSKPKARSRPVPKGDLPKWMEPYFDRFWASFPNKKGKLGARTAFRAIWAQVLPMEGYDGPTAPEGRILTLLAGSNAYAAQMAALGTPEAKIAHPATWLNAGRWADEYGAGGTGRVKPKVTL